MCQENTVEDSVHRRDQLVVASKQIKEWDFQGVQQWAGKRGIEWHLVRTGGQHFNGQAERMKKQLQKSFEGNVESWLRPC